MTDEFQQIAERVWIFPRDPDNNKIQPNVGMICTPTQTILVDGGNSPRHARRIQTALAQLSAPPISYVIYTHHHWDHVFGASVFGAPAIAHDLCRKLLIEAAAKPFPREETTPPVMKMYLVGMDLPHTCQEPFSVPTGLK